jgi:hypothetical protein
MASSRKTPTLCKRDTRQLWGTNLIHPLARDVKDTLLTRKRQLTADSDSSSLLGVLLIYIRGLLLDVLKHVRFYNWIVQGPSIFEDLLTCKKNVFTNLKSVLANDFVICLCKYIYWVLICFVFVFVFVFFLKICIIIQWYLRSVFWKKMTCSAFHYLTLSIRKNVFTNLKSVLANDFVICLCKYIFVIFNIYL